MDGVHVGSPRPKYVAGKCADNSNTYTRVKIFEKYPHKMVKSLIGLNGKSLIGLNENQSDYISKSLGLF